MSISALVLLKLCSSQGTVRTRNDLPFAAIAARYLHQGPLFPFADRVLPSVAPVTASAPSSFSPNIFTWDLNYDPHLMTLR